MERITIPRTRRSRTAPVRIAWAIVALGTGVAGCGADEVMGPPADADLAILFVGNSLTYSNDLPGMLEHLLEEYSALGDVHVEAVAYPNFGLQDHWIEGTARELIALGGWDVVIVQQGPSATEGRPSLIAYTALFAEEARAAGGELAVYMVWPSQARFFDFDGVSDSHQTAADEAGALLFPAGEAWRAAWAHDPDIPFYGPDGFHPSVLGTYVAAMVMFEQLSGRSAAELPSGLVTPTGVTPLEDGLSDLLHTAVTEANEAFARSSAR